MTAMTADEERAALQAYAVAAAEYEDATRRATEASQHLQSAQADAMTNLERGESKVRFPAVATLADGRVVGITQVGDSGLSADIYLASSWSYEIGDPL